jgi:hypothetical protein
MSSKQTTSQTNGVEQPTPKESVEIRNYKKLYIKEQQKTTTLKAIIGLKNDEIDKLNVKLDKLNIELDKLNIKLDKLNIKLDKLNIKLVSYTNSQTAKNGYKEEELVCRDLNSESIKKALTPILGNAYNECKRITGNHKCDIQSENKMLRGQVKKYKKDQFQQLDRHWISSLIESIPTLSGASQILKDLVEYPLLPDKKQVDRTKNIKKLCNSNYSQETLDNFLLLLNKCKKQLLEYAFYGPDSEETRPEYLFGVEYENDKRKKIVVFKIEDAITYLEKLNFKISPRKTCILLGDSSTFSLQRKGGDSGKKSSNQLQIKLILSNLIDNVSISEYYL